MFGLDINEIGRSQSSHTKRHAYATDVFENEKRLHAILEPESILCAQDGFCITHANGKSLYYDDVHLSAFGARSVANMFAPLIPSLKGSDN